MCGRSVVHLALVAMAAVLLLNGCGQPAPSATVASSAAAQSVSATTATPPPNSASSSNGTRVATTPTTAPSTPTPAAVPTTAPTVTPAPTLAPAPTEAPTASATAAPKPPTAAATTALDRAAVARGKAVFTSAGCALCHTIQGVSNGNQCPNLTHIASVPIASPPWDNLPNDPAFLRRWIKNPQAIKPGNLMPDLGLTDQQVNDVVAFLETQR